MREAEIKLLIFLQSLGGGGAERVATHLANTWVQGGAEVSLVTLSTADADHYPVDSRVQRIGLGLESDSRGLADTVRHTLDRVRALRAVLLRQRPDAALAMLSNANVLLAMAARGLPWLVTVGSERSHPPCMPLGRMRDAMRWYWYGRLDAVTAPTPESARWIAAHTRAHITRVVPNPVSLPLPAVPPHRAPPAHAGRKLLLAVGRLVPEKQFDLLLDVFAELSPAHPHWDLAIVGAGPEEARLRAKAAPLGSRVLLPGRAGNIGDWYRSASLFVLTSRFEGFPNALAEAMAHGLGAVSFDCDTGPRDIIRDGVDGALVPPGDRTRLASALAELMADDAQRAAFAARAAELRERLSLPRIAEQWLGLFDELQRRGGR